MMSQQRKNLRKTGNGCTQGNRKRGTTDVGRFQLARIVLKTRKRSTEGKQAKVLAFPGLFKGLSPFSFEGSVAL